MFTKYEFVMGEPIYDVPQNASAQHNLNVSTKTSEKRIKVIKYNCNIIAVLSTVVSPDQ